MKALTQYLKKHPVVYITRDIDRALGLAPDTTGFHIISNNTSAAKQYNERTQIVLIDGEKPLDTRELLTQESAVTMLNKLRDKFGAVNVLVFKPTTIIERICDEHGWTLLNPAAIHANTVEQKISQVTWLEDLTTYLPKHQRTTCKELTLDNAPYIAQFNHAHTGEGTLLIETQKQIDALKERYPDREVRVSDYIEGPIFTSNTVVTADDILIGNISYQITGLEPYTKNRFATVGNDWGVVQKLLNDAQRKKFTEIANAIGEKLQGEGWRGLFGIDVIMDEQTGKLFLLEINARQPQSTTYESALQLQADAKGVTTFEAHLCALLDIPLKDALTPINAGAQIIDRRTNTWTRTNESFMKDHNKLKTIPKQQNEEWQTMSAEATAVIDDYLNLPIAGKAVQCPYVNNKRQKLRGALRVLIGKGTPEEIVEETKLLALKKKIDLEKLDEDGIKKFLIDENIGIECSGFVYHVLDAEMRAQGNGSLKQYLKFPNNKSPVRKLLARFRTAENTDVRVFAHESNSTAVDLKDVRPGDLIVQPKAHGSRDHIFLVQGIEFEDSKPSLIFYVHANQMPADGKYDHGVRQGSITITDVNNPIEKQQWPEEDNTIAEWGDNVSLRRLHTFQER